MRLRAAVRVAVNALTVHKARAVLTSLGIIIGIAAVIAMDAAGDGGARGDPVRRNLSPDPPDPVGQNVRVERLPLRVIGVLAPKGRTPAGSDQDDEVFVPITTMQRKLVNSDRLNAILAGVRDE